MSGKHGQRLDDQLKREVDPLVHGTRDGTRPEEDPEREGIPEDEPEVAVSGARALLRDPALARREISRHLRLSVFPAGREQRLAEAEAGDAPDHVLDLLAQLPDDVQFGTVYEIWEALGGEREPAPHGRAEQRRSS